MTLARPDQFTTSREARQVHYNRWPFAALEVSLRLKSLELSGFKSFSRPTVLEFPTGITALVGPNGSGKSNVVDAIRWCLGEQSSRDLRGHRAEDVIHSGRQRVLGSTDVALTFEADITDDQEWAELSVSRRLYRSGESEYLINRDRRRLRDVQSILRAIDIDNPRFIVVNQGMADFLLSATPSERRALLEQAAGLSGYRQRRDEAAQKLSATEQNISTVDMILGELEPRIRALRRQARAVEERGELEARLRTRLFDWYAHRQHELAHRLERQRAEAREAETERTRVAEETERLEAAAEGALHRERGWRTELDTAIAALHLTERDRENARHEIDRLQYRTQTLQEASVRMQNQASEVADALRAHGERLAVVTSRLEELRSSENRLQAAHELQQREAGDADATLAAARTVLASIDRHMRNTTERVSNLQQARHAAMLDIEYADRRSSELTARVAELCTEERGLLAELDAARAEEEEVARHEGVALADLVKYEEDESAALKRLTRLQAVASRLTARRTVQARQLSDTTATRERLEHGLEQSVLRSLRVRRGWETAVAAALGPWALEARDNLASFDTSQHQAFLTWRGQLLAEGGVQGVWASDAVESDGRIPAILFSTLLVSDDVSAAAAWETLRDHPALQVGSPPLQVLSKSGTMRTAAGRMAGRRDDQASRYLHLKREESMLRARLQHTETRDATAQRLLAEVRLEVSSRNASRQRARETVQHLQRRRAESTAALELILRRLTHAAHDREAAERESDGLVTRADEARARLHAIDTERQNAELERAHIERSRDQQHAQIAELARSAQGLQDGVRSTERSLHEIATSLNAELHSASVLDQECERLNGERQRIAADQPITAAELESIDRQLVVAKGRLLDLEAVHEEQASRVAEVEARKPVDADSRDALRSTRARLSAQVTRHERARARLEELESEDLRLSEEVLRELGVSVSHLPATPVQMPPSEDEIRRLRSRAMQYAELDAAVIQEYKETMERSDYLSTQVADLRAAAEGLREIMAIADSEMRTRFQSTLTAVTGELNHVFRLMLRGGEARLEQIDDEGGIEVRALLPGKRARSSAAFSGGERALVATALLFAVLRTRPTPFCVLDEVDAALDETNVDRYLSALREISERTQVVVVTHNRATMAAANALYGLTMDGDGCSSVLSVRLDQYEAAV